MKQFIFLIFFVCLIVHSCKESEIHEHTINCYPNNSRPSQAITYQEMVVMMNAYDQGAKKELDTYMKKISGGKDTISTNYNWYKLADLKQYIAYIEKISKEKNIPVTGFRIYPSSYPKNYNIKKLSGRQTLIFTPTTTVNGKDDVAFEPLYSDIGKPVLVTEILEKIKQQKTQSQSVLKSTDTTSLESSSANRLITKPPY